MLLLLLCIKHAHCTMHTSTYAWPKQMLYHCVKSQWTVLSFNCVRAFHLSSSFNTPLQNAHTHPAHTHRNIRREIIVIEVLSDCTFHCAPCALFKQRKNVLIHRIVPIWFGQTRVSATDKLWTKCYWCTIIITITGTCMHCIVSYFRLCSAVISSFRNLNLHDSTDCVLLPQFVRI